MKNSILFVLIGLINNLFFADCSRPFYQPTNSMLFPTATKYATVLYATEGHEKDSNINNLAGHSVIKGTGQFNWKQDINMEGEYEVILSYSARKEGSTVIVNSEKNTVTDSLGITKGVYEGGTEWYRFNCQRKLLIGTLLLQKGINSIILKLNAPNETFETVISTVELVPANEKINAIKEVMKAKAARPEMNWFSSMKYGVMFHWTSLTTPPSGPLKPYKDAVRDFDVHAFVNMVEKTGADYVIFTGCWAETYIPAPLQQWEKEYTGHTTQRDLISEISDSLNKRGIKFFLYLSTHVYAKFDKVNTEEFERLNNELISEIGERYKDKIAGYWFDGWYQSFQKHPDFDFEKFYRVCKIGNPNRLVALNSWLYPIVSEWQDYWAAEIYSPGTIPADRIVKFGPGRGLQFHALLALQADWAHTAINSKLDSDRLATNDLVNYISSCEGKGPVTINIEIYQDGSIGEESLAVMENIKQQLKKSK